LKGLVEEGYIERSEGNVEQYKQDKKRAGNDKYHPAINRRAKTGISSKKI